MTTWYALNHLAVARLGPDHIDLTSVEGVELAEGFVFEWGFEQSGVVVEFSSIVGNTPTVDAEHQLAIDQGTLRTLGYTPGAGFGEQVPIDRGIQNVESQTMGQQVSVDTTLSVGLVSTKADEIIQLVEDADSQRGFSTLVSGSGFTITVFPDWIAISSAESTWTPIIVEP